MYRWIVIGVSSGWGMRRHMQYFAVGFGVHGLLRQTAVVLDGCRVAVMHNEWS